MSLVAGQTADPELPTLHWAQQNPHTVIQYSSLSPSEWLERNNASKQVTMRHIQLYLVICKKLYSGRVMHSLSRQKASTMSVKPLPMVQNCNPELAFGALKSGCLLCGRRFSLLAATLWPLHTQQTEGLQQFCWSRLPSQGSWNQESEKSILDEFYFASIMSAEIKAVLIKHHN